MTEENEHYELGGSNIERWWNCSKSVSESRKYPPSPPNKFSAEGTAAHDLGSKLLNLVLDKPGGVPPFHVGEILTVDGFDIEITEEMLEHVHSYVDYCLSLKGEQSVEEQVMVIPNKVGGTLDHSAVIHFKELHITDFKYGAGNAVYATGNKQLLTYALGKWLAIPKEVRQHLVRIWLTIYQPRIHGRDSYFIHPDALMKFHEELLEAVARTEDPNAEFTPGDWCKYCPAKMGCPALKEKTLQVAFPDNVIKPPAPNTLPIAEVLNILDKRSMIEDFLKSCSDYAKKFAEMGGDTPGRQLITTYGNRKWKDAKQAEIILRDQLEDEAFKKTLISPKQAETLAKKLKVDFDMPETIKPETGKALVRVEEVDYFEGVVIND